jgi:hypothetical protein
LVEFSEQQGDLGNDGAELYTIVRDSNRDQVDRFFDERWRRPDRPTLVRVQQRLRCRPRARDMGDRPEWLRQGTLHQRVTAEGLRVR